VHGGLALLRHAEGALSPCPSPPLRAARCLAGSRRGPAIRRLVVRKKKILRRVDKMERRAEPSPFSRTHRATQPLNSLYCATATLLNPNVLHSKGLQARAAASPRPRARRTYFVVIPSMLEWRGRLRPPTSYPTRAHVLPDPLRAPPPVPPPTGAFFLSIQSMTPACVSSRASRESEWTKQAATCVGEATLGAGTEADANV